MMNDDAGSCESIAKISPSLRNFVQYRHCSPGEVLHIVLHYGCDAVHKAMDSLEKYTGNQVIVIHADMLSNECLKNYLSYMKWLVSDLDEYTLFDTDTMKPEQATKDVQQKRLKREDKGTEDATEHTPTKIIRNTYAVTYACANHMGFDLDSLVDAHITVFDHHDKASFSPSQEQPQLWKVLSAQMLTRDVLLKCLSSLNHAHILPVSAIKKVHIGKLDAKDFDVTILYGHCQIKQLKNIIENLHGLSSDQQQLYPIHHNQHTHQQASSSSNNAKDQDQSSHSGTNSGTDMSLPEDEQQVNGLHFHLSMLVKHESFVWHRFSFPEQCCAVRRDSVIHVSPKQIRIFPAFHTFDMPLPMFQKRCTAMTVYMDPPISSPGVWSVTFRLPNNVIPINKRNPTGAFGIFRKDLVSKPLEPTVSMNDNYDDAWSGAWLLHTFQMAQLHGNLGESSDDLFEQTMLEEHLEFNWQPSVCVGSLVSMKLHTEKCCLEITVELCSSSPFHADENQEIFHKSYVYENIPMDFSSGLEYVFGVQLTLTPENIYVGRSHSSNTINMTIVDNVKKQKQRTK